MYCGHFEKKWRPFFWKEFLNIIINFVLGPYHTKLYRPTVLANTFHNSGVKTVRLSCIYNSDLTAILKKASYSVKTKKKISGASDKFKVKRLVNTIWKFGNFVRQITLYVPYMH